MTTPTGSACVTHGYAFASAASWDRTSLTTTTGATDCADVTDTTVETTTHTYDSADRITDAGYTYDTFGRTLTTPDTTLTYYVNDLASSEATSTSKQTWSLDADHRLASTVNATSSDSGSTWTTSGTTVNHYADDTDSPTRTAKSSGTITRNVGDLSGGLAATTSATGDTTLQLADLHGDIGVTLAVSTGAANSYNYDEYGNTTNPSRYGWLGSAQRASDTPTGLTLMGLRLYSPATGRFLQTDPVSGASANGYDYCNGDPINCTDLDGQCPKFISHPIASAACKAATNGTEYLIVVAGEAFCAAVLTEILPVCSGIVTGTASAASYFVETRWDGGFSWGTAIEDFVSAAIAGGIGGAVAKKFFKTSSGKKFLNKAGKLLIGLGTKIDSAVHRIAGKHIKIGRAKLVNKLRKMVK
ncbi:RHS repeat-associated core domain-containing protein [Actinacidiphila oryziradicis]|uniref:RHS repeat-associated core domain-containing protein n=1 Tax=Actinacidiphila oryziradicis TaxID=2571141 RepID=A0A4V5MWF4_9ACTN|nr:RHS repeat-associated core domain-containing protein [Actinacidiphila oryziradicis]TJZ95638.1 RHS repeat-associated core domain-containing protein [Actinacidiphila oryziradicis]